MKNLGNHNKDFARFFIRTTNQYVALYTHEYLQDLGRDLNLALYGMHGDAPHLVLAPGAYRASRFFVFTCTQSLPNILPGTTGVKSTSPPL